MRADIRRHRFGATDLNVSELGLGCARIGGIFQQSTDEFRNLLAAAFDAGINVFDTADIYSQGESERLVGQVFRKRRDAVVIATKAGYVLPAQRQLIARVKPLVRPLIRLLGLRRQNLPGAVRGELARDYSPAYLKRAVEGSLKRLATDHIDLFQLHSAPAAIVDGGEWVDALEQLKAEGKIRYYGISSDTVDSASAALARSGVSSIQVPISLLEREFVALLPRAKARGVGVIARECLANGLLIKDAAAVDVRSYCQSDEEAATKTARINACRSAAHANGRTLGTLALDYVKGLDGVSVTLIGASRVKQLESLVSDGATATGAPLHGVPDWR